MTVGSGLTKHPNGAYIDNMRACSPWLGAVFVAFLIAQPCGGAPGHFENTTTLVDGRDRHTATALPNGKVLVAGGEGATLTAELFDPATGVWTPAGSLAEGRLSHTATLLTSGKVLTAGGWSGLQFYTVASAELYDPATGTWTPAGQMYSAGKHTATLLPNGKVLVAGGYYDDFPSPVPDSHSLDLAALYDPVSGIWAGTGHLAEARDSHTATLLLDGTVLVAGGMFCGYGGCGGSSDALRSSAELYDPVSGNWSPTGHLGTARSGHTATLLPNGKVLVVGGQGSSGKLATAELYDPIGGTWSATGAMAVARSNHTATFLPSGNVLVTGGLGDSNALVSAELYNIATGTWTTTGQLFTDRAWHSATLLDDGNVLVVGGASTGSPYGLASAELYITQPLLLNISTRLNVQTGDNAMIGGMIITGAEPKTVIVRGLGPSLGIPGGLTDPVIEVHGSAGELLASNDNWRDAPNSAHVASTLPPASDLESALWGIINPGAYTIIVRGKNNETGIGLFEVYDLDRNANCELANISTRGFVEFGNNVLIGGAIVAPGSGGRSAKVLFRALGPSIPVAGALTDPTLELHDSSGTIVDSNDNWKLRPDGSSQQAEIEATGIPPTNDNESALLETLSAGNYTAILRGKSNELGIGLVEAYNLSQ